MRPARAPGRATGSSRQQGRALGVRVLTVVAARRRRGSAAWRPPRTHPPGTGYPGVVTGSGLGLTPPSHASPGNGVPRGRHRVGTEHTRWWRLPGVHARAVMTVAPPHASSENRAARSRHGVGTEHTGRAEAGLRVARGSAGGERAAGRAVRQGGARGRRGMLRRARALRTTGATLMRHACYTRKTWTPRYVPRGGVPVRNVTSTRWRTGFHRAEPTCPAQRACGST